MDKSEKYYLEKELAAFLRNFNKAGKEKMPIYLSEAKAFIYGNAILKSEYERRLKEYNRLKKDSEYKKRIKEFYTEFREIIENSVAESKKRRLKYACDLEMHFSENKTPENLDYFNEIHHLECELMTTKNIKCLATLNRLKKGHLGVFNFYTTIKHALLAKENDSDEYSDIELKLREIGDFYIIDTDCHIEELLKREIFKLALTRVFEELKLYVMNYKIEEKAEYQPKGKIKITFYRLDKKYAGKNAKDSKTNYYIYSTLRIKPARLCKKKCV